MFARLLRAWPAIRLWTINGLIVALLGLIFLDAMPFIPTSVRGWVEPAVTVIGIRQGPWGLFAPNPDNLNARLSAEIEYADGTLAHWNNPDWQRLSYGKRFIESRHCEYLDTNVSASQSAIPFLAGGAASALSTSVGSMTLGTGVGVEVGGSAAVEIELPHFDQLRALADHVARTHEGPRPSAPLRRVTLWIERSIVVSPTVSGWRPMADPAPYGDQELLFEQYYP